MYLLAQRGLIGSARKLGILVALLFCVLGGVASQSGSFLAGTFVMLIGCVFVTRQVRRPRLVGLVFCFLALFTMTIVFVLDRSELLAGNLTYQVEGFLNGTRLDNRYASDQSIAVAAWKDISAHPIAGVGAVKKADYSVKDSLYVDVVDESGFFGSLLFFIPVIGIAWKAWRFNGEGDFVTLWALAMLSTGIASEAMFLPRIGDWWWAVQGMFISIEIGSSHSFVPTIYRSPEITSKASLVPALD
ncbi:hypothetical protein P8935_21740 [Telmatobacter sp. DSM 110680]|uniref:O-antigen ligase domain-containing protein n=1 Tax=Telmatobacter sp. DSM 110680 TaxID=3036704 RepID=A0AAU7DK87_9BACT